MSKFTKGWWVMVLGWEALILAGIAGAVISPGLYALFVAATFAYGFMHLASSLE